MKSAGKSLISLFLALLLASGVICSASAADESVSGGIVIYSSMYPFVLDMLDEVLKEEFPNMEPQNEGSYFIYVGGTSLVKQI